MPDRHVDVIRHPTTGAGIAGVDVEMHAANGDALIDTATTNSSGMAIFDHADVMYPGEVYTEADVGSTHRERSGRVTGQLGGLIWADDINKFFSMFGVGVVPNVGSELVMTASGSNLTATVAPGLAVLKDGLVYYQDTGKNLTFAPHATLGRIDYVILRATREGQTDQGKIELLILEGTASSSPVAPALTTSASVWDTPLYSITLTGGQTTVSNGQFVSQRRFLQIPDATATPAAGDLYYTDASKKLVKLAVGTNAQVLKSNGTIPAWGSNTILAADLPSGIDATKIGGGSVSNTEFGYLDTVSSNIQTQLNGKAASSHTHPTSDITNLTTILNQKAPSANPTLTGQVKIGGNLEDASATGWTATAQSSLGTSPGAQSRTGGEYGGRIMQATGSSGTGVGALWRVNFVNNRADDKYTVFIATGTAAATRMQPYVSDADVDGFTISSAVDPDNGTDMIVSWFIVDRVS